MNFSGEEEIIGMTVMKVTNDSAEYDDSSHQPQRIAEQTKIVGGPHLCQLLPGGEEMTVTKATKGGEVRPLVGGPDLPELGTSGTMAEIPTI